MVKTFVYFWGLLGLIFVRDSQMPTEQREVGICGMICQSLYLSYASASQSAVLAHAVATTPKRGEHAIRATGPAWPAGSAAPAAAAPPGPTRAGRRRRRRRGPRRRPARTRPPPPGARRPAAEAARERRERVAPRTRPAAWDARLAGDQQRLAVGREPWKSPAT